MQAVPGLQEHAASIWGPAEMTTLRERFTHLRGRAREGSRQRALFVVPPQNRWSPPVYEVALMFDTWLRRERVREQVGSASSPRSVLRRGGRPAHARGDRARVRRARHRRARLRAAARGSRPRGVVRRRKSRAVRPARDGSPSPGGRSLRRASGRRHGFLHVERDATGRRPPGDLRSGRRRRFPAQGQLPRSAWADAAADHLAAAVGRRQFKRTFEPVSVQIIEMLDKAAFAQLPLEVTGDPDHPCAWGRTETPSTRWASRRSGERASACSRHTCSCSSPPRALPDRTGLALHGPRGAGDGRHARRVRVGIGCAP